ncbi:MAG: 50S ribosomal protein L25 [Bacteroidota bacterium]
MQIVQIEAQARESFGKKHNKVIRREGYVPAIIYGGEENTAVSVTPKSVKSLVYTPDFKLAEINVNGDTHKCILKEITFHPITDEIVHIDFLRMTPGKSLKVEIPVDFKGKSPGVKEGGKLIPQMRKVKVKTTPEVLVDRVYVDISELKLGFSVRVRDIEFPEGMEVMTTGATPVAIVEVPRALRSAEAKAEAEAGAEATNEAAE